MNTTDCERVRIAVMAALDGEGDDPSPRDREHLASCAACAAWLNDLQTITPQLQVLSYQPARIDLWPAVERRISEATPRPALWLIVAVIVGWRALQLFVDLPIPALHPLVALVVIIVAASLIARNVLAIETSAPELNKRGV